MGGTSQQVVARFEEERQALGTINRPDTAKALDRGTTEGP